MIVACSACSARFRVADEKIGPRGARIRCSRCGTTFAVVAPGGPSATPPAPAPPAPAATPPAPSPPPPPSTGPLEGAYPRESTASHGEKTSTGGWPTGVLELQGTPSMEAPPPTSLAEDPFAAYAAAQGPAPEPTPIGLGLPPPHESGPAPARGALLGSLPVTSLEDLEKTASVPLSQLPGGEGSSRATAEASSLAGTPGLLAGQDLSLEERTPVGAPVRDAARWSEPEATSAVAVGPDGFQEVDLAASATPPDPAFDPLEPEPTPAGAISRLVTPAPQGLASGVSASESAFAAPSPAAAPAPPGAPAQPQAGPAPPRPARLRAFAMNVLSLAALLVVTAGILLWWRGGGIAGLFRIPGAPQAAAVEVADVSSGVYGGEAGQPVVFVRGVVRATRGPVAGPVQIRVDLLRGGRAVDATTVAAGAVPWPEELAALASAEEVERLRTRVATRAAPRLEPGAGLPFVAFLAQPPGDAAALSFRVEPVPPAGR